MVLKVLILLQLNLMILNELNDRFVNLVNDKIIQILLNFVNEQCGTLNDSRFHIDHGDRLLINSIMIKNNGVTI
ncbi:hypothetical protein DERP_008474 [Dermatophagoides pteronyssinus]|uniref:Secreted protein n=1 Tax=Dermatophagoides pteronyssinus TaxID=6956 RepID=A0ABQ8IVC7_DERPT|nr:hypothetical protein DERP_008474 [Dermatophagoides pteronyssinus]